ncbi:hypothetical protein EON67_00315 [archaeon]|nr:MAG: hypothetical protein EON67_00315 [archaeon]
MPAEKQAAGPAAVRWKNGGCTPVTGAYTCLSRNGGSTRGISSLRCRRRVSCSALIPRGAAPRAHSNSNC